MERAVQRLFRDRDWSRRFTKLFSRNRRAPDGADASRGRLSPHEGRDGSEAFFLAIASGKGGTGKSFLATNLAVAFDARAKRVTLVDCDFGLANDHLLMGVNPARSIQHFFAGAVSFADVVIRTPFGPNLLPGGSGISRLGDLTEVELLQFGKGLSSIAGDSDLILLDSAAGISPQSVLTLLSAQHVCLVTNPEIAALTDAYALIKCLASQASHPPISVVVNRVTSMDQGRLTFEKLAQVSQRFSRCEIHYLGAIPEEPAVTHYRLNQPPLVVSHPTCQASTAIQGIHDQLQAVVGPPGRSPLANGETMENRFRDHLSRHRRRQ